MTVAIASGKGGTGKTTLAIALAQAFDQPVQLVDCDVEEPNAHLFLAGTPRGGRSVTRRVPRLIEPLCDACGRCADFCQYGAVVARPAKALVFRDLCHACGGCVAICPQRALVEDEERLGVVETTQCGSVTLIEGRLDVGRPTAPPIIRAARATAQATLPTIIDAPPGTACPAVAAMRDVDLAVLVAEPTPFGLHDLTLAVELCRTLDLPHAVLVNRAGLGDGRLHGWCRRESVEILFELPDDRRIAEAYAHGRTLLDALPEYRQPLADLARRLLAPAEGATQ